MVKRDNIKPGYIVIVNNKKNTIIPSVVGLYGYKSFLATETPTLFTTGTIIKCLTPVKSSKDFAGKVVEIEVDGEMYNTYWMELRIQTDELKEVRRKKLNNINKR